MPIIDLKNGFLQLFFTFITLHNLIRHVDMIRLFSDYTDDSYNYIAWQKTLCVFLIKRLSLIKKRHFDEKQYMTKSREYVDMFDL